MDKELKTKGEMDYDFTNDILFFKVKNREYSKSVEFNNMVIDIDKENFVVGIQIFEASKLFLLSKIALRRVPDWQFQAKVMNKMIEIRLFFQVVYRNKPIRMNPIIMKDLSNSLPTSQLVAVPV